MKKEEEKKKEVLLFTVIAKFILLYIDVYRPTVPLAVRKVYCGL